MDGSRVLEVPGSEFRRLLLKVVADQRDLGSVPGVQCGDGLLAAIVQVSEDMLGFIEIEWHHSRPAVPDLRLP